MTKDEVDALFKELSNLKQTFATKRMQLAKEADEAIGPVEIQLRDLKDKLMVHAHNLAAEHGPRYTNYHGVLRGPDEVDYDSDGILFTWRIGGFDYLGSYLMTWEELLAEQARSKG